MTKAAISVKLETSRGGTSRQAAAEVERFKRDKRVEFIKATNIAALTIQRRARETLQGRGEGVDTGVYRASIQLVGLLGGLAYEVGSLDERGPWIELGTGVFGPRKQVIKPKKAKFLSWISKGETVGSAPKGTRVFARFVHGRPATPHLIPAFERTQREYAAALVKILRGT